jgi:hypothetical protein
MKNGACCPICVNAHWEPLGERTYRHDDRSALTPYVQKRYRVLFEVCFANQQLPLPRCIRACYAIGARCADRAGPGATALLSRCKVGTASAAGRACARFREGDGRLMRQFLAAGSECDLVDYSADRISGVQ